MKNANSLTTMTRKEISRLYKTTAKTLVARLKRKGIKLPSGLVYPIDIVQIFDALGWPEGFEKGEEEESKKAVEI